MRAIIPTQLTEGMQTYAIKVMVVLEPLAQLLQLMQNPVKAAGLHAFRRHQEMPERLGPLTIYSNQASRWVLKELKRFTAGERRTTGFCSKT